MVNHILLSMEGILSPFFIEMSANPLQGSVCFLEKLPSGFLISMVFGFFHKSQSKCTPTTNEKNPTPTYRHSINQRLDIK